MIKKTLSQLKAYYQRKANAYNRTFDKDSVFTHEVLKDLARFCRAHESTFHPDPRVHAVMEGRREVWLRIQENLNLDIESIYRLHKVYDQQKGE